MKKTVLCTTFTLFLVLMCRSVFAMPASPAPIDVRQPDGKTVRIYIHGDERFHWYEDTDGYTVVCDNGRYAYGQLDKDIQLIATPLTVGVHNPKTAGLKKKTLPPAAVRRSMNPSLLSGSSESPTAPDMVPPSGTVKNLVILCKFSDHTLGVHTRDPGDYDILFNQTGGNPTLAPTGSVKDLYLENSYGVMTLQSTVTVWVTLPNTEAYYANGNNGTGSYPKNAQKMVEDALNLADPLVDFSQFDNDHDGYIDAIDIIHSGYGAETGGGGGNWIWSHRWVTSYTWTSAEGVKVWDYHTEPALWGTSGTSIVRFGVIAHETGHFFGLPDLYDTVGSGEGIGSWELMANSWGFDGSQLHPPHFSAWSKIKLGWVTPTVIRTPGSYTIGQAETNPKVYRINYGYPSNEYLLIENRQPVGIESTMPQGGLCIYHIDDLAGDNTEGYPGQAGWPANGNHYRVALLQADGNYNLEKGDNRGDLYDVYHSAGVSQIGTGPGNYPNTDAYQSGNIIVTGNTLYSISAAGASMSFVYDNGSVPQPPVAQTGSVDTLINTFVSITLVATDDGRPNPPSVLNYIITSLPTHGALSDPNAGSIGAVPYTLVGSGNQVVYTPNTSYSGTDSLQFKANDGGVAPRAGDSNIATVSINIIDAIYLANMDTNPGWTLDSLWEWGTPTGSGGGYGGKRDPKAGYTGTNVVGYNLLGDYENSITSTRWAKTPAIDCTNQTAVTLTFYRWLNVENPLYDHAYIQVSNNGSSWSTIWSNPSEITDSSWKLQTFNISTIADNQPTVYIRWGMGPTDSSWRYSGWNIDDVKITGVGVLPNYTLNLSKSGNGSVIVNGTLRALPWSGSFTTGTNVTLQAVPQDSRWQLSDWSGDLSGNTNPTSIQMNGNKNVSANFKPIVPNVVGMTLPDATVAITAVDNLTVGTVGSQYSDTAATGLVISQNPAGGTTVNIGSAVDLVVSLGSVPRIISGYITEPDANISVAGVFIDANNNGGSTDITDVNGYYEVVVPYNWSGTATPIKQGYTFEPNSILYNNVVTNEVNDYTATLSTFAIAGHVLNSDGITPISDVNVSAENGGGQWTSRYGGWFDKTDANGYYKVVVDYNWSGTVAPTKYAYAFDEPNILYTNVLADHNNQDYTGRLLTFTISGYVRNNDCNIPIKGVEVTANNGGNLTATDANGFYEVWVNYNWSGTVTPAKNYYTFDPNSKTYSNVLGDIAVQNYVANNIYDLDCDGSIGFGDLAIMCENWLMMGQDIPGDFYKDDDNIVNFLDLADFAVVWQNQ
ncbi:MAG: M6 family metalloprotease domain-containing protein [Planctomycetota bacterium]|nr:M6 family metalloprotease domain-containing protein [Planctomycetota bacterium]